MEQYRIHRQGEEPVFKQFLFAFRWSNKSHNLAKMPNISQLNGAVIPHFKTKRCSCIHHWFDVTMVNFMKIGNSYAVGRMVQQLCLFCSWSNTLYEAAYFEKPRDKILVRKLTKVSEMLCTKKLTIVTSNQWWIHRQNRLNTLTKHQEKHQYIIGEAVDNE